MNEDNKDILPMKQNQQEMKSVYSEDKKLLEEAKSQQQSQTQRQLNEFPQNSGLNLMKRQYSDYGELEGEIDQNFSNIPQIQFVPQSYIPQATQQQKTQQQTSQIQGKIKNLPFMKVDYNEFKKDLMTSNIEQQYKKIHQQSQDMNDKDFTQQKQKGVTFEENKLQEKQQKTSKLPPIQNNNRNQNQQQQQSLVNEEGQKIINISDTISPKNIQEPELQRIGSQQESQNQTGVTRQLQRGKSGFNATIEEEHDENELTTEKTQRKKPPKTNQIYPNLDDLQRLLMNKLNICKRLKDFIWENLKGEELSKAERMLRNNMRIRSGCRIFTLFLMLGLIFLILYLLRISAFLKIDGDLTENQNLKIEINTCAINIFDSNDKSIFTPFVSYPSESSSKGLFRIIIPGPLMGSNATHDQSNNLHFYNIWNEYTWKNCQINMIIYDYLHLNLLEFNCTGECYYIINSKKLSMNNLVINSFQNETYIAEVSSTYLSANNVAINLKQGRIQLSYLNFTENALLNLEKGDIIAQVNQSVQVSWQHAMPSFCFAAPFADQESLITTGCSLPNKTEQDLAIINGLSQKKSHELFVEKQLNIQNNQDKQAEMALHKQQTKQFEQSFLSIQKKMLHQTKKLGNINQNQNKFKPLGQVDGSSETTNDSNDNTEQCSSSDEKVNDGEQKNDGEKSKVIYLEPSCWGSANLCLEPNCSDITNMSAIPTISFIARFGNIYTNVIKEQGRIYRYSPDQIIANNLTYGDNKIDLSLLTKHEINLTYADSISTTAKDPIYQFQFNGKYTQSANFIQWHVVYNPAYGYLKPWWIETMSLGLMSPDQNIVNRAFLNPGFCPYTPNLNQQQLNQMSTLLNETFQDLFYKTVLYAWQQETIQPLTEFDYTQYHSGHRRVYKSQMNEGTWYSIFEADPGLYTITKIFINDWIDPLLTLVLSCVISITSGFGILLGFIYLTVKAFASIMGNITDVSQYNRINKVQEEENSKVGQFGSNEEQPGGDEGLKPQAEVEIIMKPQKPGEGEDQSSQNAESMKNLEALKEEEMDAESIKKSVVTILTESPPLSAFIDYNIQVSVKRSGNSVQEFFRILFSEVEDDDEEIQDMNRELINGTELKGLYERFCYLAGMNERPLGTQENLKMLEKYGFKLITKMDGQTQYYIFIRIKDSVKKNMPRVSQAQMFQTNSLYVFIETCCVVSKFDCDHVHVSDFHEWYVNFCKVNHLEIYHASNLELWKEYGIDTNFLPEQWIIKEKNKTPILAKKPEEELGLKNISIPMPITQNAWVVNRKRLDNYLRVIQQDTKGINPVELALANSDLIMFQMWYVADFIVVVAHLAMVFAIGAPLFVLTMMERVHYLRYALDQPQAVINGEEFFVLISYLPDKVYMDHLYVWVIGLITVSFYGMGLIDLFTYYSNMVFPMDKFFEKYRQMKTMIIWRIMWILCLIQFYFIFSYFVLIILWFLLGAIINPDQYLSFAASAATFVTSVLGKFAEFSHTAIVANEKILLVLMAIAQTAMIALLLKANLDQKQQSSETGTGSNQAQELKKANTLAIKQGLIEKRKGEILQINATSMIRDPDRIANELPPDLQEIAKNPTQFIQDIKTKTVTFIQTQTQELISKQFPNYPKISDIIDAIIINPDNKALKPHIAELLMTGCQTAYSETIKQFQQPQLNMLLSFAFNPNPLAKNHEWMQSIYVDLSECIMNQIRQSQEDKTVTLLDTNTIQFDFLLIEAVDRDDVISFLSSLNGMFSVSPVESVNIMRNFSDLFKMAYFCFENEKYISYYKVYNRALMYFKLFKVKPENDVVGDVMEIILNNIRRQVIYASTKVVKNKVERLCEKLFKETALKKEQMTILTLGLNYMRGCFQQIPDEIIKELVDYLGKVDSTQYFKKISASKNRVMKKEIEKTLMVTFELIEQFLQNFNVLENDLENIGEITYSVSEMIARPVRFLLTARMKEFISDAELRIFKEQEFTGVISQKLCIHPDTLMGIIYITTERLFQWEVIDVLKSIFEVNTIEKSNLYNFLYLYILYQSQNEDFLFKAFEYLGLELKYLNIFMVCKGSFDPKYLPVEYFKELGIYSPDILMSKDGFVDMNDKEKKKWVESVIKDLNQFSETDTQQKIALVSMDMTGPVDQEKLQKDIQAYANDKNQLMLLSDKHLSILQSFLSYRVVNPKKLWNSDYKTCVNEFAKILNINEQLLEQYVILFCELNPDKMFRALMEFDILKDISYQDHQYVLMYLQYATSKVSDMQRTSEFTNNRIKPILKIDIETEIIQKIIYNNLSPINRNGVYSICKQVFGGEQKFFSEILPQVQSIFDFAFSCLKHDDINKVLPPNKQTNIGLEYFAKMLNTEEINEHINNYLQMFSKFQKKQQDIIKSGKTPIDTKFNTNDITEVQKLFISLYSFLSGKSNGVVINGDQSIIRYLMKKMNLPIEFFQSLYLFYCFDNEIIAKQYVKMFRRLNYMNLLKTKSKKEILSTGASNILDIEAPTVYQFLNLVSFQQINTSFFSRELGINIEILYLIQVMVQIKHSKVQKQREQIYDQLRFTPAFKTIFNRVKIDVEDFVTLLKIMYIDYQDGDVKWILENLKMEGKVSSEALMSFMELDFTFDLKTTDSSLPDFCVRKINEVIKSNNILEDKFFSINKKWGKIAIILNKGYFGLLRRYVEDYYTLKMPQLVGTSSDISSKQAESMLTGICGILCCQDDREFYLHQFMRQLNQKLFLKFTAEGKESGISPKSVLHNNSSQSYALYLMTKNLKLNPVWILLFKGDTDTWQYICKHFYNLNDQDEIFMDPKLILTIVLNYKYLPCAMKQLLSDYEWVSNHLAMLQDQLLKTEKYKFDSNPEPLFTTYLKYYEDFVYKIINSFTFSYEKLFEIAEEVCFPKSIFKMIANYEESKVLTQDTFKNTQLRIQYGAIKNLVVQDENLSEYVKDEYISKLKTNCVNLQTQELEILEDFLDKLGEGDEAMKYFQGLTRQTMRQTVKQCFNAVESLFTDPRTEQVMNQLSDPKEKNIEEYIRIKYFLYERAQYYSLGVISSISCLRKGYIVLQGKNERGEDLNKLFAIHIDYVLSTIEKFNVYSTMTEFFCKFRSFPYVSLSVGNCISTDSMIRGNVLSQFSPQDKIVEFIKLYEALTENHQEQELKREKLLFKFKWVEKNIFNDLNQNNKVFSKHNGFFRIFQKAPIQLIINSKNYSNIYEVQEEMFSPSFQIDAKIQYRNYCYDAHDTDQYYDYLVDKYNEEQKINVNFERQNYVKLDEKDPRSQQDWEQVLNEQKDWNDSIQNESFQTIIDMSKEMYQGLLTNQILKEKFPREFQFFYGFLALNGGPIQFRDMKDYDDFTQYISAVAANLGSDRKALTEILSFFMPGCNQGWSILSYTFDVNDQLMEAYTNIALGDYKDLDYELKLVIDSDKALSEDNKITLFDMIKTYMGDMSKYIELANFSSILNPGNKPSSMNFSPLQMLNQNNAPPPIDSLQYPIKMIKKLLWGFDFGKRHTFQKFQWSELNILENTTISFEHSKNTQFILEYLWQVAVGVNKIDKSIKYNPLKKTFSFPQNLEIPNLTSESKYNDFQIHLLYDDNQKRVDRLLDVITSVCDGDFSDLFDDPEKYSTNLMEILGYVFQIKESTDLKIMQSLTMLRPTKKLKNEAKKSILEQLKNYQQIIIQSGIIQLKDLNEQTLATDLLLGLQMNSISSIIDCYRNSGNQYAAAMIQSIQVWKNLGNICSNIQAFEKYFSLVQHSLLFLTLHIYKQLDTIQKDKQKIKIDQGEENKENGSAPDYIKDILAEFENKENQFDQTINDMLNENLQFNPNWSLWIEQIDVIFKNPPKKFSQYKTLLDTMTGKQISTALQGNKFTQYLLQYYCVGCKYIYQEDFDEIDQIPDITTVIKDLFDPNENNLTIFNNFLKFFIVIQKMPTEEGERNSSTIYPILFTIKSSVDDIKLNEQFKNPQETKEIIKEFMYFFIEYDLNDIKNPKEIEKLILELDQKNEKYNNLMSKLLFQNEVLKNLFSQELLFKIFTQLRELSEFQNKKVSDLNFANGILDIIRTMTGQETDNIQDRQKLQEFPLDLVKDIFKLSSNDLEGLYSLLLNFHEVDENKTNLLKKFICDIDLQVVMARNLKVPDSGEIKANQQREELQKKMEERTLSTSDMFDFINEDGNETLSQGEFREFCNKMGMNLSNHRINEIYANIKKQSEDPKQQESDELDKEEFEKAFVYLQQKNSNQALDNCGNSLPKLTGKLIFLGITLLLVFAFIFFGIRAFSLGGSFNSVVNSVLPMSGGGGATASSTNEFEDQSDEKTEEQVNEVNDQNTSSDV